MGERREKEKKKSLIIGMLSIIKFEFLILGGKVKL